MDVSDRVVKWLKSIENLDQEETGDRPVKRVKLSFIEDNRVDQIATPTTTNFYRDIDDNLFSNVADDVDRTPKANRKRGQADIEAYPYPSSFDSSSSASSHSGKEAKSENATAGIRSERVDIGRLATSPVHFVNVTSPNNANLPGVVTGIIKSFSDGALGRGFIPPSIKAALEKAAPLEQFYPEHDMQQNSINHIQAEQLARYLTALIKESADAFTSSNDENTWYKIVDKVLGFELTGAESQVDELFSTPKPPRFTVESSQSKHIYRHLFPRFPTRYQTKRVDFSLQFNPGDEEYRTFYEIHERKYPLSPLSPFKDPTVKYTIPAMMIEVKAPGVDYFEAQYQATLATIPSINHRKVTSIQGRFDAAAGTSQEREPDLPLPFLTVIGHGWSLHWYIKMWPENP
ncbi:hypothetical protein TWF281_001301 [Arthrobotrys megalospora]